MYTKYFSPEQLRNVFYEFSYLFWIFSDLTSNNIYYCCNNLQGINIHPTVPKRNIPLPGSKHSQRVRGCRQLGHHHVDE